MEKEEEPQPGLKIEKEGPTNYPETSQPSIHSVHKLVCIEGAMAELLQNL